MTAGLTEGFKDGEGEGDGVGSGVGEGVGELFSPKTAGWFGNKTDLTQNPDPVSIKTRNTKRNMVNFEGLLSIENIIALYSVQST